MWHIIPHTVCSISSFLNHVMLCVTNMRFWQVKRCLYSPECGITQSIRKALWVFEYGIISRTILRVPGVKGMSLCIAFKGESERHYVRSMDYMCLQGLSDVVTKSILSQTDVTIDKILIDKDVMTLSESTHTVPRNAKDSANMGVHFNTFVAACKKALRMVFVVVHFGVRNRELVLCHGLTHSALNAHIQTTMNTVSEPQVSLVHREVTNTYTILTEVSL